MFLKRVKRHKTPFGVMIHKRGPIGTNLLVTKNGRKLKLNYRKLLKSLRLKVVDGKEVISFSSKIHPKHIGEGEHGKVFRIFSSEEAKFLESGEKEHHVPSVILKVYHPDNPQKGYPDGFTQFFANSVIFNWLKKQTTKKFLSLLGVVIKLTNKK